MHPALRAAATILQIKKSAAYQVLVTNTEEGKASNEGENFDSMAAGQLYQRLATVYAGVYAIASAMASAPLRVLRGGDRELPDHPLAKMLGPTPGDKNLPNPEDTSYDLIEQAAAFLELSGDSYMLLEGGQAETGGPPRSITPLRPHRTRPITNKQTKVAGYLYSVQGRELRFPREQVVHLQYFSPVHDYIGQGSVEPATMAAIVDLWAIAFNRGFFKRGATLSGVLKTPEEMTGPMLRRLVEEFRQDHGGSDKAWDVKGLSHDMDFKPLQPSHKDMLFENLRKMNREEILMALGVPPVMVTLLDGATYANAQEQKRQFWELTVLPKLKKLAARLNKDLAPRWGSDITVFFDTSDVPALQPDRTAIITAGVPAVTWGILTRNDVRAWANSGEMPALDPLEDGDVPLLPMTAMPAEEILSEQPALPAPASPPGGQTPPAEPANNGDGAAPEDGEAARAIDRLLDQAQEHHRNLRRKATWRAFDRNTRTFGRVFARIARTMFSEQLELLLADLDEVLARAVKGTLADVMIMDREAKTGVVERGIDEIELIIQATLEENRLRFEAAYSEAMLASGTKALADIGVTALDFNVTAPEVLAFLKKEGAELVTNVTATTIEALKKTLAEGIATGENALDLSDRVRHVMGDSASRARANTIGRTESIKSFNAGAVEAYKQTQGLVKRKRWLATLDGDVRETHADADNQVVGLNDSFQVGGSVLQYPGDPSGDPEETINCRCTVEPILEGEPDDVGLALAGNNGDARRTP